MFCCRKNKISTLRKLLSALSVQRALIRSIKCERDGLQQSALLSATGCSNILTVKHFAYKTISFQFPSLLVFLIINLCGIFWLIKHLLDHKHWSLRWSYPSLLGFSLLPLFFLPLACCNFSWQICANCQLTAWIMYYGWGRIVHGRPRVRARDIKQDPLIKKRVKDSTGGL